MNYFFVWFTEGSARTIANECSVVESEESHTRLRIPIRRRQANKQRRRRTTHTRGNSLKKSFDKKCACETVCLLILRYSWGQELSFVNGKTLTIYKWHQIVINELEIGAVCTDFSRRTSWWARENSGRARTWRSMKTGDVCEM
jgi:hypothetical protein